VRAAIPGLYVGTCITIQENVLPGHHLYAQRISVRKYRYIGMHSKYSGVANILEVRAHTHCLAKERDTLNSHWMWLDACRANMHSVTSVK
jgi:hypothetical protein